MMDKAESIIKRIEGSYDNITRPSIQTMRELLLEVDIDLWEHLKSDTFCS